MLARRDLLVSDAERDAVADFLQVHYTAGRLTHDELSARLDATYRSRWRSELLRLSVDLPPVPRAPEPAPAKRRSPRMVMLAVLVLTIAACGAFVAQLPDELQILLAVFVVPMLIALAVIVVPFMLLIAGIRWLTDKVGTALAPSDPWVGSRVGPR